MFKVFKHYWCYVTIIFFNQLNQKFETYMFNHFCYLAFPINRTYLPFVKVISPTQQVNVICECFLIQTHKSSSKPQKNSHNLNLRSKISYLLPFEGKTKFNILFIFCWIKMKLLCSMHLLKLKQFFFNSVLQFWSSAAQIIFDLSIFWKKIS